MNLLCVFHYDRIVVALKSPLNSKLFDLKICLLILEYAVSLSMVSVRCQSLPWQSVLLGGESRMIFLSSVTHPDCPVSCTDLTLCPVALSCVVFDATISAKNAPLLPCLDCLTDKSETGWKMEICSRFVASRHSKRMRAMKYCSENKADKSYWNYLGFPHTTTFSSSP